MSQSSSAYQPDRNPGRATFLGHERSGAGFFVHHVLGRLARYMLHEHYADVALMEDILRDSGLDWTSVQVPLLTDKPLTGTYRTAYGQSVRGGFRIARADAAQFMLRVLGQPETIGHAITVAY